MIGWAIYWDTLHPNPGLTAHADGQPYPVADADGTNGQRKSYPRHRAACQWTRNLATWRGRSCGSAPRPAPAFSAITTAVTCGSVNCMHDSLNPLAGLTP